MMMMNNHNRTLSGLLTLRWLRGWIRWTFLWGGELWNDGIDDGFWLINIVCCHQSYDFFLILFNNIIVNNS